MTREPSDILITNGTVLTMDPELNVIEDGQVAIRGEVLTFVGERSAKEFHSRLTLDARGGLILPGLINGHTHAAMTLFRGLADDLPLMEWLEHYVFPVEKRMDAEFVHVGALLACAEMILAGTTTFCDMYLFEGEVARAAQDSGMRSLVGEVLYDFPSPNYGALDRGFEYTEAMIRRYHGDPLVRVAVEPHSLFTCSPELLQRADRMARDHQVPLILHLAETRAELDEVRRRYGRKPVDHLLALGVLGPHLIADHCVHLEPREMDLLAEHEVRVVHNPESNMKLASGIAPVPEMIRRGIPVGLGTDGCASNNDLDLFTEMDTAAKIHKLRLMDTTVMDAATVLKMATCEGARTLGMEREIGSLEVGKKADVVVVDTHKPHLTPMYNPYSHLVYAARGSDVTHAVINGRVVMAERKVLTLDVDAVLDKAMVMAEKVRDWLSQRAAGLNGGGGR
jgi:5-methylthioadenosine/S-adenosylhomocysteine deaminase